MQSPTDLRSYLGSVLKVTSPTWILVCSLVKWGKVPTERAHRWAIERRNDSCTEGPGSYQFLKERLIPFHQPFWVWTCDSSSWGLNSFICKTQPVVPISQLVKNENVGGRARCSEKPGTLWPWLTVTKTESALESWGLPRMLANLFLHCCPGVPDLPILSPQPALLLLPLGASCLPSSRKPLSPASKKEGRMSPCPGQVVGQERAAPALTHCWEEREKPAALAG